MERERNAAAAEEHLALHSQTCRYAPLPLMEYDH